MSKKLIIAVDGPAGSGKSSTFKKVAAELGYGFIDTGLMYRAFTLLGLQEKVDFDQPSALIALIPQFNYRVAHDRVYLNQHDVTNKLSNHRIVKYINKVTGIPEIRDSMVQQQRQLATNGQKEGLIMVGRDITSVVLPKADLKIYLDSSVQRRVQRRLVQNNQSQHDRKLLTKEINQRDLQDKSRTVGPLVRTKDAWYIDNSHLNLAETVAMVVNKVRQLEQ